MNDFLIFIFGYMSGWILLTIGYVIYKIYFDKDISISKKLILYNGFKCGIFSWIGIIFIIAFYITMSILIIDEYITDK